MKLIKYLTVIAFTGFLVSCAATKVPIELSNARQAYQHAMDGPAAQLSPAELHKAKTALDRAETSFTKDPNSFRTKDLAYVAERKAMIADALGSIASQKASTIQAKKEYQTTQSEIIEKFKADSARKKMERTEADSTEAAAKLAVERQARLKAEKQAADAMAELAKIAALNEESRGLVITLSGSVVFASNQATILPTAQSQLNQVTEALMSTDKYRKLTVEGHTDSRGSQGYNMQLSQRRAESVRSYLISRGYPADLVEARGVGEVRPIVSNASPEGRSNNRRVEIIIQREAK